jgi:hypothetical protein
MERIVKKNYNRVEGAEIELDCARFQVLTEVLLKIQVIWGCYAVSMAI